MCVPPIQRTAEATDKSWCKSRAVNMHECSGTMMSKGMSWGIGSQSAEKSTREWVRRSMEHEAAGAQAASKAARLEAGRKPDLMTGHKT